MDTHTTQPLEPFTPAHAHFLARLSDTEFWSHAADIAQRLSVATQKSQHAESANDYLLCELEQGWCLLPFASLHEVVVVPTHFTRLPLSPSWVLGLMAWRDETIAVIHLTDYLLLPSSSSPSPVPAASPYAQHPLAERSRIAIVSSGNSTLGLHVASADTAIATTIGNGTATMTIKERVRDHEALLDIYQEVLLLNMEVLVTHITQQIGVTSPHE